MVKHQQEQRERRAVRRRLMSAQECADEWKALWSATKVKDWPQQLLFVLDGGNDDDDTSTAAGAHPHVKSFFQLQQHHKEKKRKKFDCSSLISHEKQLVERHVRESISKWRALEDRKVQKSRNTTATSNNNNSSNTPLNTGWMFKVRLPYNFDYLSELKEPPHATGDDTIENNNNNENNEQQQQQVISLSNPNKTESYERELWKIFHGTKTVEQLRRDCGLKHALSADIDLRMSDRHDLPPPPPSVVSVDNGNSSSNTVVVTTTVFLEVWKQEPREGASPDSNRMVLEFLGDQTLLDVHLAVEELTEDGLWTGGKSGMLLIEGTFYTAGEVDYVTPILNWLEEDRERYNYLGLSRPPSSGSALPIKRMDTIQIQHVQWSLNTRYLHLQHGNIESALFLTDIRQSVATTTIQQSPYPIIHDIWTPSYASVRCEGCQQRSATLVTPSTCEETDGAAQICQSCHDSLFRGTEESSNAVDIHTFKQQQHDMTGRRGRRC